MVFQEQSQEGWHPLVLKKKKIIIITKARDNSLSVGPVTCAAQKMCGRWVRLQQGLDNVFTSLLGY